MRKTEQVPRINPNETFPIGDVADEKRLRRATAWVAFVDTLDKTAFHDFMDRRYTPRSTDSISSRKTYNASVYLCKEWDNQRGDGRHFVSTGFIISRAFMNDTALYPNCDSDLYSTISQMKNESSPAQFSRAAWRGMADSHPNIFNHYRSLYDLSSKRFELGPAEKAESFIAGLALPYMLSVAGKLEAQAKELKFTSLSSNKYDLRTTEFKEFFSSQEPLANDNPQVRLNPEI